MKSYMIMAMLKQLTHLANSFSNFLLTLSISIKAISRRKEA